MIFSIPGARAVRAPASRNSIRPSGARNRRRADRAIPERLLLEALEQRRVLAAVPTVSFVNDPGNGVPLVADPFIGEQSSFTLRFNNASPTDAGFGPYVDLYFPSTGADGDDGFEFSSATYQNMNLAATTVTLTDAGVPHPFAKDANGNPLIITPPPGFKAGDKLVVLQLPFGSFTAGQPPVDIAVSYTTSNLADVGTGLPVQAQAGFRYGNDGLDNPTTDPTITGTPASQTFTPALFRVTKENLAHEHETATGPNFTRQFRVRVDVADGQTVTDLELSDTLPDTLQYVSLDAVSGQGSGSVTIVSTPSPASPGGTLARKLDQVVGTTGGVDAEMTFSYFVPVNDVGAAAVIDATTGDDRTITNIADASGDWTPLDPRDRTIDNTDPSNPVAVPQAVSSSATNNHDLVAKSLATQKSVANVSNPGSGPVPGNVLEYTVNFQVSDYFAFDNLVITDLLGDGQSLDGSFAPRLTVNDGHSTGAISGVAFAAANLTEEVDAVGGADRLTFRVSDELALRGFSTNGRLVGGMIPAVGTGGGAPAAGPPTLFGSTTGSITFRAVVNDKYDVDFPSGDAALDPGDRVTNNVTIAGGLLAVADLSSQGTTEADTSSTSVTVPQGSFSKDVYAVNGTVGGYPATTPVTVGDTVTYRLRYTLPTSDVENLVLTDYLPLPIFDVDDVGTGVLAFDSLADGTGDAPAAGRWTYNSGDTFHTVTGLTPTITNDSAANSVIFRYGTYDDLSNTPSVIDILFTVTANAQPFADSLRLANRATLSAQNTNQEAETGDKIAEVTSSTPELRITKGIVATDNAAGVFTPSTVGPVTFDPPNTATGNAAFTGTVSSVNLAAQPINSNLSEVDNGDLVTYAIVVENRGSGRFGAFDTVIKDSPAAGMGIPGFGSQGINLRVTDGAGNPLAYTRIGTGLFEGGIQLVDPTLTQGAIRRGIDANGSPVTDGSNIVVITYDMRVLENPVLSQLTNTGAVTNYAATEGGPDFTGTGSLTDPAVITIATNNLLHKELVSTEFVDAFNANNEAVVGELVTYRVTITVPEAIMPNAVLVDKLDTRTAFVDMVAVTPSPGVTISGSFSQVVSNNGQTVTFNIGDITNSDTNNATTETITFEYRAVVLNASNANAGGRVRNTASLTFSGLDNPKTARAATVTIIEPRVAVTKSAAFDDGQPTGDADDAVTYTITLRNPPGSQASTADAFDVTFEDALPKLPGGSLIVGNGTATPTFSVTDSAGTVTAAAFELVGSDAAGYTLRTTPGTSFDLPVDNTRTITITIHGKLPAAVSGLVTPGDVINNTAAALWSSLDGDFSTPRSTYNPNSVERTGAGGINDYRATASADLRVAGVGIDKSVVATSESATTNADRVVVGEIVRYRLEAVVPEGTSTSLVLQDQIPAGLQFLDDGTAFVAFISNGGGMTSSTITGSGPNVTGSAAGGVTPTFRVPAAAISGGPSFSSGTDVSFDFGSVTNADSDADSEFIVVEFNALVTNVVSNQADASLTNRVNVLVNSATTGTASTVVRVAEPVIRTFTKQAVENDDVTPAVGPFDAGDSVRYLIDLVAETGNGRSIAYDTLVSDTLPVTESFVPGSLRVFRNNTQINAGFTTTVTGQKIDVTVDEIAPGDEIRVFYDVTLTQAVVAGATVINTADLTYTSLPSGGSAGNSTGSVTPGLSGSETGERNGSGGINDYSGQTSTTIAIKKPEIEKSIFEASPVETASNRFDPNRPDFTIGEVVTFRLTATLPEGTTQLLVLSDQLPVGMEFLEDIAGNLMALPRVVAVGGNIAGSSLAVGSLGTLNAGGTGVSFDFGTVINAPDGLVDANDQIVVELQTQVQNIPALVAGGTLTNTGVLTHTIGSTSAALQDAVTADIVEPSLETTKEIVAIQRSGSGTPTATAPTGSVSLNRGDIVTYRVTVQHGANSSGPAFTVRVADTLPAGLTLVPGSLQVVQDVVYASSSFYDATLDTENTGSNAIEVVFDYIDVPGNDYANPGDGNVAVIEYRAVVEATAPVGTLTNTADVTYDSLYTERTSTNFPSTTRAYATDALAHVLIDVNSIAGHVYVDANNNGVFDAGEQPLAGVTMQLDGTDANGSVGPVTVVTAADGSYLFGNLNPGTYAISQPTQPAGYADGKDVVGTTQPAPTNFGGTIPGGGNGIGTDEITTIVIPAGAATANNYDFGELVVDLSVTKTDGANVTTYVPGVDVTYTITVTNEGVGDVAGAVVTDHLPSGTTFVRATNGAIHDGGSPGIVTFAPSSLAANGGTASFQITIRPDAARTGNLVNEATVATPPGTTDPTPGNNTSTDINTATPRVDLAITKTDGQTKYSPGQSLTYTIEVSNAGPSFARGAVVADTIPAVMTNVNWTAAYTGTNSNGPVSGSGNAINETIDLAVNGTAIFTVTGTVDPSATGDLENTARVFVPPGFTDPTPGNNEATDIDEIEPRVDLAITKTDGSEVSQAGAVTTYTIIVTNNGPGTAVGARVQDPLPANVTGAIWTATFSPGSGGVTSGSGPLDTTITLLPGGAATYTFAATVSPTAFGTVVNTASVTAPPFSVETNPSNNTATDTNRIPILVTGIDADCDPRDPQVTVIDPFTGIVRTSFNAYPNEPRFRGGVRVALGDVDGDGIEEIITTPGPGRVTEVRVFRQDGTELTAYRNQPYGSGYLGGADVASGDVDGDGDDDVVTSMIRNAGDVRVLKAGSGRLAVDSSRSIRAFPANFKGGATVTTADLTGDGKAEVIVGSGPGMPASVRIYDVASSPRLIDQFTPIGAGFTGGVSVKSAFWNQDGTPDIIVAGGRGAGSVTEIYDGTVAAAANTLLARDAVFAGLGSRNAATNASGVDLDGDNRVDRMFTTQGSGGTSTGVTATDRAGSTVGSATVQRPPLRLASSAPRVTSGDVIWGPVRPLITTASGLQYREIVIGTGATPTSGQTATVHYVGSRQNGAVFGSSRESGMPLSVRLQQPGGSHPGPTGTDAGLILGWIEALEGMRVGGRRTLIIPANLAYGDDPPPNSGIQPGDTLVFDIELLAVAP